VPRNDTDWEALARHEPYFRLLTRDGVVEVESSAAATSEFFETGEADLSRLLSAVAAVVGHDVSLGSALDFGCGVGRLTLPLARRANAVLACDIAPTMLDHVRRNAEIAGLQNVTAIEAERLLAMSDATLTFVCSLLVFQYIPEASGCEIIRNLLRLLSPSGIAALQVVLRPPNDALRRLASLSRKRSHRAADHAGGVQRYTYDAAVIASAIESADAQIVGRLPTRGSDGIGDILVIQKTRS
jgi:SAM-dependent methyltransferase